MGAMMCRQNGALLFTEDHDIPLFLKQIQILGGPPPNELDQVGLFSDFFEMETKAYNPINQIIPYLKDSQTACNLLHRLLTFGPTQRITAKQALNHPFFEKIHGAKSENDDK